MNYNVIENNKFSKIGWDQIAPEVFKQLEEYLNAKYVSHRSTSWKEDGLLKIDEVVTFEKDDKIFTKNIQFRFWHWISSLNRNYYLTVRYRSWSISNQDFVDSEFFNGSKIDYFVQGYIGENNKVISYVIIDWKNLFPYFNKNIFAWDEINYVEKKYNTYFYYLKKLTAADGFHENTMITIPLFKNTIVNNIDKSIETLFPNVILFKKGFD